MLLKNIKIVLKLALQGILGFGGKFFASPPRDFVLDEERRRPLLVFIWKEK